MSDPAVVAAASSAGFLEGIGSEVVVCVFILLAGLILVAAWLSTYVPQDMRPIAVFVFENFGRNRPQPQSAAVTAADPQASTAATPPGPSADTQPQADSAEAASSTVATATSASIGGFGSHPSVLTPVPAAATTADLTAYDVDVLESDGDLDPEMRERVEDVLQEYTQVMEARSDSELRNRRLKYFNCLLAPPEGSADDSGAASSAQAAAAASSASAVDSFGDANAGAAAMNTPTHFIATAAAAAPPSAPATAAPSAPATAPPSAPAIAASPPDAAALGASTAGRPPGSLLLRLKYFNDDLRTVTALPSESIANFKRKHFQPELSRNMNIRLIYNGRELKEGTDRTLASYSIPEEATIHCLITERNPGDETAGGASANAATDADGGGGGAAAEGQGDIGSYMFPLFGGILGIIWYCRVCYKAYFNFMSTMALGAVTLLFFAAFFASWTARPPRQAGQILVHRINLDAQQQQQQPQPQEQQS